MSRKMTNCALCKLQELLLIRVDYEPVKYLTLPICSAMTKWVEATAKTATGKVREIHSREIVVSQEAITWFDAVLRPSA